MGAGAWGTALAKVLADAGNSVTLWARRPELADEINETHRNSGYLGDFVLPASIRATSDAAAALDGAVGTGAGTLLPTVRPLNATSALLDRSRVPVPV